MTSRVAREIRDVQLTRFAAMTPDERVALARQLGENDLRSYMIITGSTVRPRWLMSDWRTGPAGALHPPLTIEAGDPRFT